MKLSINLDYDTRPSRGKAALQLRGLGLRNLPSSWAWDAVQLIMPESWLHRSFVVIDPTDLGVTKAVARNLLQD